MLIRKLFKFENAYIVRCCSTRRCSHSIHGHSDKVELLLEAHAPGQGRMIGHLSQMILERPVFNVFQTAIALHVNGWKGRTLVVKQSSRASASLSFRP